MTEATTQKPSQSAPCISPHISVNIYVSFLGGEMPWCKNGSPALTLGGLVLADTDVDEGVHSASLCRDTNGMFLCNISTHSCLYNDGCIIIIIIQSIPKIFFVLLRDEKQHSRYPWVCRLDKHNAKRMEGEDENKK